MKVYHAGCGCSTGVRATPAGNPTGNCSSHQTQDKRRCLRQYYRRTARRIQPIRREQSYHRRSRAQQ